MACYHYADRYSEKIIKENPDIDPERALKQALREVFISVWVDNNETFKKLIDYLDLEQSPCMK